MGCCTSKSTKALAVEDNALNTKFAIRRESVTADGITPNVGFVLKTWRHDNTKIFINMFYHPFLKSMYPIAMEETMDKKGRRCFVYGVQVPSLMYTESGRDINVRNKVSILPVFYIRL